MYTIQCDFDDTITVNNVSEELRKTYTSEEWRGIEDGYKAGQFSVEESNRRQFALIQATEERTEQYVIRTTLVRPGFSAFVKYCQGEGIQLAVVSSGVYLYIDPILRDLGLGDLERYSGTGRVGNHGVTVRYADPFEAPLEEGFKLAHLLFLKQRQRPVIYIGDGASDIASATVADFVIARSALAEFCRSRNGLNKSVDCSSTHRKLSRADGLFRVSLGPFLTSGSMISMTFGVS